MMQKMNKKGLEFKSTFFSVVAVSMIIIAVGIFVSEWNESYNSNLQYDLSGYDKLDDMSGQSSKYQGNISVKTSVQGEDFEGTSIRAVFGILNNIYKPFQVVFGENGMISLAAQRFGIPTYITQGIITLMIFAITFALIAVLFRLTRRSA